MVKFVVPSVVQLFNFEPLATVQVPSLATVIASDDADTPLIPPTFNVLMVLD